MTIIQLRSAVSLVGLLCEAFVDPYEQLAEELAEHEPPPWTHGVLDEAHGREEPQLQDSWLQGLCVMCV